VLHHGSDGGGLLINAETMHHPRHRRGGVDCHHRAGHAHAGEFGGSCCSVRYDERLSMGVVIALMRS